MQLRGLKDDRCGFGLAQVRSLEISLHFTCSSCLRSHYDHLDVLSIRTIGNSATWFIPKGMRRVLLDNGVSDEKIVELE